MASSHPKLYKHFSRANTTAFISSDIVILLAAMRTPTYATIFFGVNVYATLVSMLSIGVSYGTSLIMTNPGGTQTVGQIVAIVVAGFIGIIAFVLVCTATDARFNVWRKKRQNADLRASSTQRAGTQHRMQILEHRLTQRAGPLLGPGPRHDALEESIFRPGPVPGPVPTAR